MLKPEEIEALIEALIEHLALDPNEHLAPIDDLKPEIQFTRLAPDGTPEADFGNGLQPGNTYEVGVRLVGPWWSMTEGISGKEIAEMAREAKRRKDEG